MEVYFYRVKNYDLPFPKRQTSDAFKLKEFTDAFKLKEFAGDNFKFDKNGRKFSEWEENTVGKGEIAHYKQFLLFPQCLQKTFTADT